MKSDKKYLAVFVVFILFCFSLFNQYKTISKIQTLDNKTIKDKFTVVSEPIKAENYIRYTVKSVNGNQLPQNAEYLFFDYSSKPVNMGDIIDAKIVLKAITNGEYKLYDYSNSIYATATVKSVYKTYEENPFYKFAASVRNFVKIRINENFDGDAAGLLKAITIGGTESISNELYMNIKATGVSHIIVVSGMHLSIIMAAVYFITDRIFYNKYLRCLLSLTAVLSICLICGFSMSVTRAGIMFLVASIAPIFDRENDSISSLMTAVCAVIVASPLAVFNISFQLSVLATLSIIWAVPFYLRITVKRFKITSKLIIAIISVVYCSVFATVFTLPIVAYVFGYISVIAPITNLFVMLAVTVLLSSIVPALLFCAVPILKWFSVPLMCMAKMCAEYFIFIVNTLAKLPITIAVLSDGAICVSLLLLFLIIAFMYIYDKKEKKKRSEAYAKV